MANPNRWLKLINVAGAATRFRVNVEERREAQRLAMMAALAYQPQEAHTRAWEAQIPADVDAPMRQLNDALAMEPARDVLTRARQACDIWPPSLERLTSSNEYGDVGLMVGLLGPCIVIAGAGQDFYTAGYFVFSRGWFGLSSRDSRRLAVLLCSRCIL